MNSATITASITSPMSDADLETMVKRGEEIQKMNETNKFKISIELIGIKKRCRKSERHSFQLGHVAYNNGTYCPDILKDQIRGFLDTNMKEVYSDVRVHLDHIFISNEGGFTTIEWEPFSDKNKRFNFNY
jgi:hypothetical protein